MCSAFHSFSERLLQKKGPIGYFCLPSFLSDFFIIVGQKIVARKEKIEDRLAG